MNDRYHIAVRLKEDEKQRLKIMAIKENKRISELVRELIINKIKED